MELEGQIWSTKGYSGEEGAGRRGMDGAVGSVQWAKLSFPENDTRKPVALSVHLRKIKWRHCVNRQTLPQNTLYVNVRKPGSFSFTDDIQWLTCPHVRSFWFSLFLEKQKSVVNFPFGLLGISFTNSKIVKCLGALWLSVATEKKASFRVWIWNKL